jgi:hypothetical protein
MRNLLSISAVLGALVFVGVNDSAVFAKGPGAGSAHAFGSRSSFGHYGSFGRYGYGYGHYPYYGCYGGWCYPSYSPSCPSCGCYSESCSYPSYSCPTCSYPTWGCYGGSCGYPSYGYSGYGYGYPYRWHDHDHFSRGNFSHGLAMNGSARRR